MEIKLQIYKFHWLILLIKFGDLVKISGIDSAGSDIINGEFSVVGTSNDLKTFSFLDQDSHILQPTYLFQV
ncbi:MAG: hypothetical protein CM15mP17_13940 [Gammaproteobacteria bacterium]|nr:MAG: hypothetical protein CM15mP17_13940 [Gammaproteobacteria bacterium]